MKDVVGFGIDYSLLPKDLRTATVKQFGEAVKVFEKYAVVHSREALSLASGCILSWRAWIANCVNVRQRIEQPFASSYSVTLEGVNVSFSVHGVDVTTINQVMITQR